jgi:hypothetical protein
VAMMEDSPSAGFAHSNFLPVDADGEIKGPSRDYPGNKEGVEPGLKLVRRILKRNPVACPSVMFRKAVFDEVGQFYAKIRHCADIAMWIQIALFHDAAYIEEPLIKIREHEGQDSRRFLTGYRNAEQIYTAAVTPLDAAADRVPTASEMREQFRRDYLDDAIREVVELSRAGNLKTVVGILGFAVTKYPGLLVNPKAVGALLRSAVGTIGKRI